MSSFPAVTSRIRLFRAARALALGMCVLGAFESCTSVKDDEPSVPSQPGAVQPDTTGVLIDEATACSELNKAESSARSALQGCASAKHVCPDYIRPAGGAGCYAYDKGSVAACVKLYGTFESCDDFDVHPCLITAVSECGAAMSGGAGAAGMGGEGGMGGAAPSDAAGSGGALVDSAAGAGG